jgi:uncharacterized protein DUF4326
VTALPSEAAGWSRAERSIASALLDGWSVVVNVRKSGPHKNLVPWLEETGRLTYVGHAGPRHPRSESDFANPFLNLAKTDRAGMLQQYRQWLSTKAGLLRRIGSGELSGRALGCWCAPQACHADVLAEEVNVHRRPG